jgi:hypothetical protein
MGKVTCFNDLSTNGNASLGASTVRKGKKKKEKRILLCTKKARSQTETSEAKRGMLPELVANPIPNVIASSLPTNRATTRSSSRTSLLVPVVGEYDGYLLTTATATAKLQARHKSWQTQLGARGA